MKKHIQIRDTMLESGKPSVCSALVGKNKLELLEEGKSIFEKKPDVIEWRADFFERIDNPESVIDAAFHLRELLGNTPLIFTVRSEKEGGQPINIDESTKMSLIKSISKTKTMDMIDYEVENDSKTISALKKVCTEHNIKLILSFHNFKETPSEEEMTAKLEKAVFYKADIGKLAVMPRSMADVLSLLQATKSADENLDIPIITMSMGTEGALTRLAGWKFGSILTFAVGRESSAPGQVPIEVVRELEKYLME